MHTPQTRLTLLTLSAGLAFALTACGGSDSPGGTVALPPTSTAPSSIAVASPGPSTGPSTTADGNFTAHNDADIEFITGMHPHHQGALAMAQLATTRAAHPKVKALAASIAAAQGPEIARMQDMAQAWGVELDTASGQAGGHGGGHGGGGTSGARMDDDAAMLEELSGPEFDRQFLTSMTKHHEGALPMARTELEQGSNPQAKAMAQEILDTQQSEITEMKELTTQL